MKYSECEKSKLAKLIIVNLITLSRLIGALLLPIIYYYYGASACANVTIILFLTDCVDGFLARRLHIATFLGSALDAASDKLLNFISFVILSIEHNSMLFPLVLEIAILYTVYATYRYGGNVQSTIMGKIKTIVLDVCVILSFLLISISSIDTVPFTIYINDNISKIISILAVIITIFCLLALIDYVKINKEARKNPKANIIKYQKKKRKPFKKAISDAIDTEYYKKHKDESIMKQFYY